MVGIRIKVGQVSAQAELNDSATAKAVAAALPLRARANTWGDEIYFSIPVSMGEENPRDVVQAGDLAYWPPGKSMCIFWGPTPASRGNEIRPASAVNVVGRIIGDPTVFGNVPSGAPVEIEKA
jgi:uncharacterized protein